MIVVVEDSNVKLHAGLLEAMFRLRARVFRDKMGWDVAVSNGIERDRFDDESPVYIINAKFEGTVRGALRLLPTTGVTLVGEVFADTAPDAAQISSPSIWECTRFCVDYSSMRQDPFQRALSISAELVIAMGQVALRAGIDSILGNFDATMLRIYRRIGCDVDVIGSTSRFGKPVYLGAFPVSQNVLDRIIERTITAERIGIPCSVAA